MAYQYNTPLYSRGNVVKTIGSQVETDAYNKPGGMIYDELIAAEKEGREQKYGQTFGIYVDPATGKESKQLGGVGGKIFTWIDINNFDDLPDPVKLARVGVNWRTGKPYTMAEINPRAIPDITGYFVDEDGTVYFRNNTNPNRTTRAYYTFGTIPDSPVTKESLASTKTSAQNPLLPGKSYQTQTGKYASQEEYAAINPELVYPTGATLPTSTSGTATTAATTAAGTASTTSPFSGVTPEAGTPIDPAKIARQSAYDFLYEQFNRYGLGSMVEEIKGLVESNVSPSEFAIRLRQTPTYKKRFAANDARIKAGYRALSEGEYIALEDQYQNILRNYGLPSTYYSKDDIGRQEGFEKFISGDVSPAELEDRVQLAYNRVINANPEVGIALRTFYPDISSGDIIAYALDPEKSLETIKRKITAAEIGGAAVQAGLTTNESDAAYLARYGITKQAAEQGYRTISGFLPRAQQLSSIYGKQVEGGPYTQASAEREVFGVPGAAEEERKRLKITSLEQASFAGQAGLTGGALGRERAGQF